MDPDNSYDTESDRGFESPDYGNLTPQGEALDLDPPPDTQRFFDPNQCN